ncbi:TadE family type IV pilus minor pilin [Isoptericola variabilis]|uniref:TadE family protein n=1 Tax=Isoptericola variabilis (strain 225) TaxID=743718 RepID=F6FTJ4_ISOV2|nr:TadE family type IV pilus minor pilin [Isoptericola variabilis]AEG43187.1 TadE family protein [Isoptericola variabilis 225]TWH35120.1 TadE-like protein [Isoptericola variabilis J7]
MTRHRRTAPHGRERGSVTAELAVGLPVVALLLVAVLTLAAASTAQMRALDAARAAARALAVGESAAEANALAVRLAGDDTAVSYARDGDWVEVTVTRPVAGGWLAGAPLRASGEAVARVEP